VPNYTLTALAEPGGATAVVPLSINENADVVGMVSSAQQQHATSWRNEVPTLLHKSGQPSAARGLDVQGRAVGSARRHAVMWHQHTEYDLHDYFPSNSGVSEAYAINDAGIVAGTGGNAQTFKAALFDVTNSTVDRLNPLPGHTQAACTAINAAGHAAGYSRAYPVHDNEHVFVFDGHKVVDWGRATTRGLGLALPMLSVTDMNIHDTVIGWGWTSWPGMMEIGFVLSGPQNYSYLWAGPGWSDYWGLEPFAINDDGVIVGRARSRHTGLPDRAWVHFPSGPDAGFYDLNKVTSNAAGWQLECATGLNNAGEIVGYGSNPGGKDPASGEWVGTRRGFVLKPTGIQDLILTHILLAFVQLIGGVAQGGGGFGILPGGKPIPIDPHGWRHYTQAEKDMLLASIVHHIALALSDEGQAVLRKAADEIMEEAAKRLDEESR
jgi:hypothetical protein